MALTVVLYAARDTRGITRAGVILLVSNECIPPRFSKKK